jgi:hypothetical protein
MSIPKNPAKMHKKAFLEMCSFRIKKAHIGIHKGAVFRKVTAFTRGILCVDIKNARKHVNPRMLLMNIGQKCSVLKASVSFCRKSHGRVRTKTIRKLEKVISIGENMWTSCRYFESPDMILIKTYARINKKAP